MSIRPARELDKIPEIKEMLAKSKPLEEIVAWAKAQNLKYAVDAATKDAEQLPMQVLPRISQMKDGQVSLGL